MRYAISLSLNSLEEQRRWARHRGPLKTPIQVFGSWLDLSFFLCLAFCLPYGHFFPYKFLFSFLLLCQWIMVWLNRSKILTTFAIKVYVCVSHKSMSFLLEPSNPFLISLAFQLNWNWTVSFFPQLSCCFDLSVFLWFCLVYFLLPNATYLDMWINRLL